MKHDSGNIVDKVKVSEFKNVIEYCISKLLSDKDMYYASQSSRQLYQLFAPSLKQRVTHRLVYYIAKHDVVSFKKLLAVKTYDVLMSNIPYMNIQEIDFYTNPILYALYLRDSIFVKAIISHISLNPKHIPRLISIMANIKNSGDWHFSRSKSKHLIENTYKKEFEQLVERWLIDDEKVSIESLQQFLRIKLKTKHSRYNAVNLEPFFWVNEIFVILENRWVNQDPLVSTFKLEDIFFRLLGWAYASLLPRHMLNVMCSKYDRWSSDAKFDPVSATYLYAYHPQKRKMCRIFSSSESGYSLNCGTVIIRGGEDKPRLYNYDNFHYDPGNRIPVFSADIKYDMACFRKLTETNDKIVYKQFTELKNNSYLSFRKISIGI